MHNEEIELLRYENKRLRNALKDLTEATKRFASVYDDAMEMMQDVIDILDNPLRSADDEIDNGNDTNIYKWLMSQERSGRC